MSIPTPHPVPVPKNSFLGDYARRGAYTDCYTTSVPIGVNLAALIEAFYTTRLFKLERWVLAHFLKLPSTDSQAKQLAASQVDTFAAWKVEHRSDHEILLNAGQTRLWLCVSAPTGAAPRTTLMFGSAVVPVRKGGKFGLVFHALLGFHKLYSRLLLAAAARKLVADAIRESR